MMRVSESTWEWLLMMKIEREYGFEESEHREIEKDYEGVIGVWFSGKKWKLLNDWEIIGYIEGAMLK